MIARTASSRLRDLIATIAILPVLSLGLSCSEEPRTNEDGSISYKGLRIGGRSKRQEYQAFRDGGGPLCGADSAGREVFCEPRSVCRTPETNSCFDFEMFYHAFREGGGPLCGTDSGGREVFCQPRTNCSDPEKNRCKGAR